MKFTLEIELGTESLTFGMVRDALDYDDNWPKPDGSVQTLNVIDVNGNTVGKWQVTESAKTGISQESDTGE